MVLHGDVQLLVLTPLGAERSKPDPAMRLARKTAVWLAPFYEPPDKTKYRVTCARLWIQISGISVGTTALRYRTL